MPALVAGNAVVPAGQPGRIARSRAELLYRAGPRALYAIVFRSARGAAITDNCDYLDVHRFIGDRQPPSPSTPAAGLSVSRPNPGGKNPMIAGAGCQLDAVAKAATVPASRTPAVSPLSDLRRKSDTSPEFGDAVRNTKLGTAYDFSVDMGSLISEAQLKPCPVTETRRQGPR